MGEKSEGRDKRWTGGILKDQTVSMILPNLGGVLLHFLESISVENLFLVENV